MDNDQNLRAIMWSNLQNVGSAISLLSQVNKDNFSGITKAHFVLAEHHLLLLSKELQNIIHDDHDNISKIPQ